MGRLAEGRESLWPLEGDQLWMTRASLKSLRCSPKKKQRDSHETAWHGETFPNATMRIAPVSYTNTNNFLVDEHEGPTKQSLGADNNGAKRRTTADLL